MARKLKQQKGDVEDSGTKYKFPDSLQNIAVEKYFVPQAVTIIEGQIVTIAKFFNSGLCDDLISSFSSELALETTPLIKSKDYAARYNDRASVVDYEMAGKLHRYLKNITDDVEYDESEPSEFSESIGLNPQFRVYRYEKGHHFGKHYDESVRCQLDGKGQRKGRSRWTLLIYLSGDEMLVGGDTVFYHYRNGRRERIAIHPSKGLALLHKHGDDCLQHEGEIVERGVKWVLRSDVVF